jgi:hypothetical protein
VIVFDKLYFGNYVFLIFQIVLYAILIVPVWKICGRAGFHPALSLVAIIPVLGLLLVAAILAFSEWPASNPSVAIEKE